MQVKRQSEAANGMFYPRNRKERRALAKKMKISNEKLNEMLKATIENIDVEYLPTGQKVRLKADQILSHESELSVDYINFVKEHRNDILTVERDPAKPEDARVVCLKEDPKPTGSKWLFDYIDLEVVVAGFNDEVREEATS